MSAEKTVLLVDDDADFVAQERLGLEAAGFKVLTAETQKQAEELLATTRPDVAVVDLMLEHMDGGFALCHHIKTRYAGVAVLIVSSVTAETGLEFDASTAEERSWVKADAMIAKPVRFEQLVSEIERLVELYAKKAG